MGTINDFSEKLLENYRRVIGLILKVFECSSVGGLALFMDLLDEFLGQHIAVSAQKSIAL